VYFEYISISILLISLILLVVVLGLLFKSIKYYIGLRKLVEAKIKPVGKPRKRYIVFTALCEEKTSLKDLEEALREMMIKYYGVGVYRKASPQIIFFDEAKGVGVIRVLHTCTKHLIATLGLTKRVGNTNCILIPLKTTGTLKKAKEYIRKNKI